MQRVLQIGYSYDYGGIETFIVNYYRVIDRSRIQFDFLNPYKQKLARQDELEKLGANIISVPDFHSNPIAYKNALRNILKEYEVVHVHMLSAANMLPLKVATEVGVKRIIAHSHNTMAEGFVRDVLHRMNYRLIRKKSTTQLACSVKAGEWMFGSNVNFKVFNNAVDSTKYKFDELKRQNIRNELGVDDETLVIGNVGRLNVQKNHKFLVEIFSKIIERGIDARLILVGQGELENQILAQARGLGIEDKVMLLGIRLDVDSIYSGCDCIVMPSIFEGLPLVLVEAQANGLKCFASKDCIPSDCKILDSMEFISLSLSSDVWAEKIINANFNRNKSATEEIISAGFDTETQVEKLHEIYLG